jgi:hypothetical protein
MSERSAHDPVHDAATPREAILVGEQKYEIWLNSSLALTSRGGGGPGGGGSFDDHDLAQDRPRMEPSPRCRRRGRVGPGMPARPARWAACSGEHPAVGHDRGRLGELTNVW